MAFNYTGFINEITLSLSETRNLSPKDWDKDTFRNWRHKLTDSIYRIERQGYSINCNISTRQFHIYGYGSYSKSEQDNLFNKHLADTVNELKLIIEQFQKYGEPSKNKSRVEKHSTNLDVSEKITMRWVFDHMSLKGWFTFFGLLSGAFASGYGLHAAINYSAENKSALIVPSAKQEPLPPPKSGVQ